MAIGWMLKHNFYWCEMKNKCLLVEGKLMANDWTN